MKIQGGLGSVLIYIAITRSHDETILQLSYARLFKSIYQSKI